MISGKRFITKIIFASILCAFLASAYVSAYEFKRDQPPMKLAEQLIVTPLFNGKVDVIVYKDKINLWKACKGEGGNSVTVNGSSISNSSNFGCYFNGDGHSDDVLTVNGDHASIGVKSAAMPYHNNYGGSDSARSEKKFSDKIKIVFTNAAERYDGGEKYNIVMTISDITVMAGDATANGNGKNSISVMYGYRDGGVNYSAFAYNGWMHNFLGIRYKVEVKLQTTGGKNTNKKMLWAFNDIDIISDLCGEACSDDYYDGSPTNSKDKNYAEHVALKSGVETIGGKQYISVVKNDDKGNPLSVLGLKDGVIFHKKGTFAQDSNGNIKDYNYSNALLLVNANSFVFEWGGSGCATQVVDTPAGLFENETEIYYGGKKVSNSKDYEVNSSKSEAISYKHFLKRTGVGSPRATANYQILKGGEIGGGILTSGSVTLKRSTKDNIYNSNVGQLSLNPDQRKTVWQAVNYTRSTLNDSVYVLTPNNNACTLTGYTGTGVQCIQVHRPPAYFEGKISFEGNGVGSNNESVDPESASADLGNSSSASDTIWRYITLPSTSGKYNIRFTQTIKRSDAKNHSAGDTVSTRYKSYTKKTNYFKKQSDALVGGSTNYADTSALYDSNNTTATPNSQTVLNNKTFTQSSDNDGELLYGEIRTFCNTLTLATKQGGNQDEKTRTICVQIQREAKQCDLLGNTSGQKFGVNFGRNYGRIRSTNQTTGTNGAWAGPFPKTGESNEIHGGSIYAKPGDSIRFDREMCAGAFYTVEVNGLTGKSEYNTRYGASGKITKSDYFYMGSSADGYLFKTTVPVVNNKYTNPAQYAAINSKWWRWSNGNGGSLMSGSGFMSGLGKIEAKIYSPDGGSYGCSHPNQGANNGAYQVAGKESGCHTDMFSAASDGLGVDKFDVGGTIEQTLSLNSLTVNVANNAARTVTTSDSNREITEYAEVKVPYNYILKPFVENTNSGNDNQRVVYLGETYTMSPGVVTAGRNNFLVYSKDNRAVPYATITKETTINVRTYLKRDNKTIKENYGASAGNYDKHMRLNTGGDLANHTDSFSVSFTVEDTDKSNTNDSPRVGDEICTEITVWPADSHDDPNTDFTTSSVGGANNSRGASYNGIALSEGSIDGAKNSRTTASCSRIAKRPTMSVESANAYSAKGYNVSRYQKNIDSTNYNFSSWSEYGVFGKITKRDNHLISGAAVAYDNGSSYHAGAGQSINATRDNDKYKYLNNVSKDTNSNTCLFEAQTIVNADCKTATQGSNHTNDSENIGGQSVADYVAKIKSRYGDTTNNSNPGDSGYWRVATSKTSSLYRKLSVGDGGQSLRGFTDNSSNAVVIRLTNDTYIGSGGVPAKAQTDNDGVARILPKAFYGKNEDHSINYSDVIDYNRTLVYNATGKNIVLDSDIVLNDDSEVLEDLDDVVGGVIFADNVYITSNVTRIDAIIIAKTVNTCAFADINENRGYLIENITNLHSGICNNTLVFNAPVIVSDKIILNRTAGAGNGVDSIKRAEIFNLSMANYLWSYNQMSRYSQATTTYSRELPSRY